MGARKEISLEYPCHCLRLYSMSEPGEESLDPECSSSSSNTGRAWKRCRHCKQHVHDDPKLLRYCSGCGICERKDLFPEANRKNGRWWCSKYRPCKSKERHCVLPSQLAEGETKCTTCKEMKETGEDRRLRDSWNNLMERWLAVPSNKRKLYEAVIELDSDEHRGRSALDRESIEDNSQSKRKKRRGLGPSATVPAASSSSSSSSSSLPVASRSKREKPGTKKHDDDEDDKSFPKEVEANERYIDV